MSNKKPKRISKVFTFEGEKGRLITIAVGVEYGDLHPYGDMWLITIGWSICRPGDGIPDADQKDKKEETGRVIALGRMNKYLDTEQIDAAMVSRPSMALIEAYANDCYRDMVNHPEKFYILSKKSVKEELELKEKAREKEQEKIDNAEAARKNKEIVDSFLSKNSKADQAVKAEVKRKEESELTSNPMLSDDSLKKVKSEPRKKRKYSRRNKEYWDDIDSGANTRGRHAKKPTPVSSE